MSNRLQTTSMGMAHGHAGEFLQGAVYDAGQLRRVLVSIPAPGLRSNAIFTEIEGRELTVSPKWKQKSLEAFRLAWLRFSSAWPCGTLAIHSDIPVSRGLGSSTADCVAAVRAAASYWNQALSADQIAALVHQAECFSDATMYQDRLVVFQHCDGRIHEYLDGAVPNLRMLIVESGGGARKVETDLLVRPNYTPDELRQFAECLSRFRLAAANNDVEEIAAIAGVSARINQRYHPKQKMQEVERVASASNALGVAVAHSGDIQVILYRPDSLSDPLLRKVRSELEEIGMKCSRTLSTLHEPEDAAVACCAGESIP